VLSALNHGLDGGLTDAQATAMAAPFCAALGESGCMCGALTGAVMSSGLLLGRDHPHRHRHAMRDHARRLHDRFKAVHGATCCRALSGKVKHDKNAHFQFCADLTAHAAEMAARLILRERPELAEQADQEFLDHRQSVIGGAYRRVMRLLFG
jgi:C_GCAxxG_C_C family probable redox protein